MASRCTRREFLLFAPATTCALLSAGCRRDGARTVRRSAEVGELSSFAQGLTPLPFYRIAVLREPHALAAVSMVCTHQVCLLQLAANDTSAPGEAAFQCPCHGSRFDSRGAALSGPATESLPWYKVSVNDGQVVVVDFSSQVEPTWRYII